MTKWTDEEKKLLLKHYDDYASRRRAWMLAEDYFPKRTTRQITAQVLKMKKSGEWEILFREFGL